jgi:hypothetical protein
MQFKVQCHTTAPTEARSSRETPDKVRKTRVWVCSAAETLVFGLSFWA